MDLARSVRLVIGANLLLVLLVATVLVTAGRKAEDPARDAMPPAATDPADTNPPTTAAGASEGPLRPPLATWPSEPQPPADKPDLVAVRPPDLPEAETGPAAVRELPPETPERIRETRWLLKTLLLAVELHRGRRGQLPPSGTEEENEVNAGVEALLARLDSEGLLEPGALERWTGDTDGDGRPEILDAWGNPLVYFRHDRYDGTVTCRIGGRDQAATPRTSALTGEYHARDFVQIWSAGPNGENEDGGGDDVTSWHIRE